MPSISPLIAVITVVFTVIGMEFAAAWIHKHIMHGPGWGWHKSHHVPGEGHVERNDLYSICFGVIAMGLFWAGSVLPILWWVGVGLCVYGVIYYCVHDGLVHNRWPFRYTPRKGYLRRIYDAHHLHHAVQDKDGAVSFGFLFVAPRDELRARLNTSQTAKQTCAKRSSNDREVRRN